MWADMNMIATAFLKKGNLIATIPGKMKLGTLSPKVSVIILIWQLLVSILIQIQGLESNFQDCEDDMGEEFEGNWLASFWAQWTVFEYEKIN